MDKYVLTENGKVLHKSFYLSKLINYTAKTTDAIITYSGVVIWVQRKKL